MRLHTAVLMLAFLLLLSAPANSVLLDRGTGMIYDTELGITWLQDANYAQTSGYDSDGRMTWCNAMAWVEGLSYGGYSDWRLPKTLPVNPPGYNYAVSYNGSTDHGWNITSSNSEMSYNYYVNLRNIGWYDTAGNQLPDSSYGWNNSGPFFNIDTNEYWSGTEADINSLFAWSFNGSGLQDIDEKDINGIHSAWAVRDGDFGPSVSTEQSYLTDYILLGDTFSFDYWWEMGIEPTDGNFDILFFNGTEWETFGWELNFDGSSDGWQTASYWVPPWARGENVQMMFSLLDWGQFTDPTVYLRNIGSNSAPVPEPSTIVLMGLGLVGLAGFGRKRFKSK